MQTANKYVPDYLVTPGEVLEDYLGHAGLTQATLADRTGLSKKTIAEIVKAKSAITAETALVFERTLGHTAHFWSNLERQYQEDKERLTDKLRLEKDLQWLDMFPINAMAKHGWIEKYRDGVLQLEALLRFFAIASPQRWETIWGQELQTAFRKKESSPQNATVISAWLRKGEIDAQQQRCASFDKQKFQYSLSEIRMLTVDSPKVFVPKLRSICAAAGIAVVFVPALPKLGIYGATRRFNDKYLMQLSLYGKTNDQLWFTFFHEACHIIKHSHGELYIESPDLKNEEEKEANIFAGEVLIPSEKLSAFLRASSFKPTIQRIRRFAADIGVAPGIVVGRLQHDKIFPMSWGNDLKVRYTWT